MKTVDKYLIRTYSDNTVEAIWINGVTYWFQKNRIIETVIYTGDSQELAQHAIKNHAKDKKPVVPKDYSEFDKFGDQIFRSYF